MKRLVRQFAIHWMPLCVWMGIIFNWSSLSANTLRTLNPNALPISNFAHFANFAILAVLAYRAFCTLGRIVRPALWGLVLAFVVLYAISDEMHQAFTPGRTPSTADLAIDTVGGIAGLVLADMLWHRMLWRIGPSQTHR